MADNEQRPVSAPQFGIGFVTRSIQQVRLAWALIRDDRVPLLLKAIPLLALIYVISPIDLIPDFIPVLGQVDDVGIAMLALSLFNALAPADVVAEHQQRLSGGTGSTNGPVIDIEAKRNNH
jgi:uncharacterized membrane protein YkvA (DUF1232 family)